MAGLPIAGRRWKTSTWLELKGWRARSKAIRKIDVCGWVFTLDLFVFILCFNGLSLCLFGLFIDGLILFIGLVFIIIGFGVCEYIRWCIGFTGMFVRWFGLLLLQL